MGYVNKYYAPWASRSTQGYIYIDQLDYVGLTLEYGLLYNRWTAINVKNIAASGWRLSTLTDWDTLKAYIGGWSGGGKLKETGTTNWLNPNTGATNEYGFNARGSGRRTSAFIGLKETFRAWTSDIEYSNNNRSSVELSYDSGSLISPYGLTEAGYYQGKSIRLVKESTTLTHGQTGTYTGNDGRVYGTICIGTQEWLSENLSETKYRDGSSIPEITDDNEWRYATTDGMCAYNNEANWATELTLEDNNVAVSYLSEDWENHIIACQAEFSVINDKTNFFELLPLLSAEEREYHIRIVTIYPTSYTIFEGFLNCETVTQKYLHKQTIKFAASGYLKKLEYFHPVSIDTIKAMTFIDIIDEILQMTGASYNIRVNCKIHAEGDTLSTGQTLFNKNGFWTELFWEDAVERVNALDILKNILTTFDCYIYWWQGYWYIEKYEDLWSDASAGEIEYVEYTTDTSYDPADAGSVEIGYKDSGDVHDLVFTEQSQTLSIIPGLKTMKITLEDMRILNLAMADLTNAQDVTQTTSPEPDLRKWQSRYDADIVHWTYKGQPKSVISNAICRDRQTPNIVPDHYGLSTKVKLTVDENTVLNISFKYLIQPNPDADTTEGWKGYTFTFHWYLRIANTGDYFCQKGDGWAIHPADDETTYLQEAEVSGDDFDRDTNCAEVSMSIPIGEVIYFPGGVYSGKLKGDQTLVLCIGSETISKEDESDTQPSYAWFGDINITTSGDEQDNVIEGTVNSKFLNKKEISLKLYDMESYSYKNGVLRGDTLEIRTERWGTATGTAQILSKGLCWSTSEHPTTADSKTVNGTGYEAFTSIMTGLSPGLTYYYRAYAVYDGGTIYGNEMNFTTLNLQVGVKYRGGIIAYIFEEGDEGYVEGEIHGLIAGVKDLTPDRWGNLSDGDTPYQPGAYFDQMGDGQTNTTVIMDAGGSSSRFAAKRCVDYANEGYNDWYLPTMSELRKFRDNRTLIGGFYNVKYWSSTERSDSKWKVAYRLDFAKSGSGGYDYATKNEVKAIRPVSYF